MLDTPVCRIGGSVSVLVTVPSTESLPAEPEAHTLADPVVCGGVSRFPGPGRIRDAASARPPRH